MAGGRYVPIHEAKTGSILFMKMENGKSVLHIASHVLNATLGHISSREVPVGMTSASQCCVEMLSSMEKQVTATSTEKSINELLLVFDQGFHACSHAA